ncbi:hypothetical protein [Gynuella sunshinyii]|uniref:hypothetical protein n=1 Tax=Gynuella sunshinyii TaxID=1445505 RepID=UPI0005CBCD74|nr:hypothetical protein [Gynuella sunshinyii]
MHIEYEILETFEITGRGVVVVISEITNHTVATRYPVQVVTPDGNVLTTTANKEWLLRRQSSPIEQAGYLLTGLSRDEVPSGSRLRFIEGEPKVIHSSR